jgi:hypothetical protein
MPGPDSKRPTSRQTSGTRAGGSTTAPTNWFATEIRAVAGTGPRILPRPPGSGGPPGGIGPGGVCRPAVTGRPPSTASAASRSGPGTGPGPLPARLPSFSTTVTGDDTWPYCRRK